MIGTLHPSKQADRYANTDDAPPVRTPHPRRRSTIATSEVVGAYTLTHTPALGAQGGGRWSVEHESGWRRDGLLTRAAAVSCMMGHMTQIPSGPPPLHSTTRATLRGTSAPGARPAPSLACLVSGKRVAQVVIEACRAERPTVPGWLCAWYLRYRLACKWEPVGQVLHDAALMAVACPEQARNRSLMWDRFSRADSTSARAAALLAQVDSRLGLTRAPASPAGGAA